MKHKIKSLAYLFAVAAGLAVTPMADAAVELVNNGSLSGSAGGWTLVPKAAYSSAITHSGSSGSIAITPQCATTDCDLIGEASQALGTLNSAAGYHYSFWAKGIVGGFSADFFDTSALAAGNYQNLGSLLVTPGAADVNGWSRYAGDIAGPLGAATIDFFVELKGSAAVNAQTVSYIDDISVTERSASCIPGTPNCPTVPEPGSLLLVGAALAAIAVVRRTKKA